MTLLRRAICAAYHLPNFGLRYRPSDDDPNPPKPSADAMAILMCSAGIETTRFHVENGRKQFLYPVPRQNDYVEAVAALKVGLEFDDSLLWAVAGSPNKRLMQAKFR